MPNKEEVLKWYQSLQETLRAEGIDVTKSGDLMRIRSYYFQEDPDEPGDIENGIGDIRYAFAKKKIEEKTGQRTSYEVPMPEIPKEKQKDDFIYAYDARNNVYQLRGETLEALEKAREEGTSLEKISNLEESYRLCEKDVKEADKKYRKFCDELWKEQDQWLLTNNKFFDPEKDYEQIEDLYNQASKGLLFLNDLSGNAQGRKQILVQEDGKSVLGPSFANMDAQKMQHGDLYLAKGERKQKLEQKYGEIPSLREIPRRPKALPEPKKPGAFSWFKRIISFGFAKGDFDRYDQQKREQEQRREEIRQYDANLPQLKEEIRQHNLAAYKRYDEIVTEAHEDEYPNVKNAGRMALMNKMIDRIDLKAPDDNGVNNIWNEQHEMSRRNHMMELATEYKENPESFDKNGIRNKEVSEKYWDKKITINTETLKEMKKLEKKREKSQVKKDLQDRVLKEKAESRKKNELLDTIVSAEQADSNLLVLNPWIRQNRKDLFTNIGKLFGMGAQYGMDIFLGACLQNQKFDAEGNPRPPEEIKSNAACEQDLEVLVYYANHLPKTEEERQKLYDTTLERFELMAQGLDLKRVLDSISSIVADNVEDMDQKTIKPYIAQAASLVPFLLAQKKGYDLISEGNQINGSDVSVSTALDREFAMKLGAKCAKLQDGYQRKTEIHKSGVAKNGDDVVKGAPTKNLSIKRPLDLGK